MAALGRIADRQDSVRYCRKLTYPAVGPSHPRRDATKSANDTAMIAPASRRVPLPTYMSFPSMLMALVASRVDVRNQATAVHL